MDKKRQFGLDKNILEQLKHVIKKYPKVDKVVIYGSRASDDYKDYSDIDIAIFGKNLSEDEFSELWNELNDLPILFNLDIVHFETITNKDLQQEISNNSKILYQHKS